MHIIGLKMKKHSKKDHLHHLDGKTKDNKERVMNEF